MRRKFRFRSKVARFSLLGKLAALYTRMTTSLSCIMMTVMVEKGLVTRDESTRTHVYQAAQGEEPTQACLLDDLLQKAFQGSSASLVVRALSKAQASDEELDAIEAYLRRLKENRP